jgi:hypothetical protein
LVHDSRITLLGFYRREQEACEFVEEKKYIFTLGYLALFSFSFDYYIYYSVGKGVSFLNHDPFDRLPFEGLSGPSGLVEGRVMVIS